MDTTVNTLQKVIGAGVFGVWLTGYLGAFFIDRSLEPLATSVTPVMVIVASALFATEGIRILKGKRDE